jgi:hypothetical protein
MNKRITFFWAFLFLAFTEAKADHFWTFQNLQFVESPVGSGIYDISFQYVVDFQTVANVYYELYVAEDGCNPTDGFNYRTSGCISYNIMTAGTFTQLVDANIPFCPGKRYAATLFTRRMCNANTCCTSPTDRANNATPLGQLTKFPNIRAGDPTNIWAGMPMAFNAMNTYPNGGGSDFANTTPYDGNWAYIYTIQNSNADPLWNFALQVKTEDCISDNDVSVSYNSVANADVSTFRLDTNTVRCGSPINLSYQSNNNCGPGFPGNTFELIDNSTIIDAVSYASSTVMPMGVGVNVGGRFESITSVKQGFACSNGDVALTFRSAACNTFRPVDVKMAYTLNVLYPTSNFAAPTKVNCSDMCGQDLVLRGSDPEWKASPGINQGNSTTLPPLESLPGITYTWTGQVCQPVQIGSSATCLDGDGNVYVVCILWSL